MTLRIFSLRNQGLLAALLPNCAWKEGQAEGGGDWQQTRGFLQSYVTE